MDRSFEHSPMQCSQACKRPNGAGTVTFWMKKSFSATHVSTLQSWLTKTNSTMSFSSSEPRHLRERMKLICFSQHTTLLSSKIQQLQTFSSRWRPRTRSRIRRAQSPEKSSASNIKCFATIPPWLASYSKITYPQAKCKRSRFSLAEKNLNLVQSYSYLMKITTIKIVIANKKSKNQTQTHLWARPWIKQLDSVPPCQLPCLPRPLTEAKPFHSLRASRSSTAHRAGVTVIKWSQTPSIGLEPSSTMTFLIL